MYLRLLLSIFTNLLQIQFVIVADRRSSEHTFSRYHEALLILAFPRFSSQTLLPFYATLKLGWKCNLDKDGIFVGEGEGRILSSKSSRFVREIGNRGKDRGKTEWSHRTCERIFLLYLEGRWWRFIELCNHGISFDVGIIIDRNCVTIMKRVQRFIQWK